MIENPIHFDTVRAAEVERARERVTRRSRLFALVRAGVALRTAHDEFSSTIRSLLHAPSLGGGLVAAALLASLSSSYAQSYFNGAFRAGNTLFSNGYP